MAVTERGVFGFCWLSAFYFFPKILSPLLFFKLFTTSLLGLDVIPLAGNNSLSPAKSIEPSPEQLTMNWTPYASFRTWTCSVSNPLMEHWIIWAPFLKHWTHTKKSLTSPIIWQNNSSFFLSQIPTQYFAPIAVLSSIPGAVSKNNKAGEIHLSCKIWMKRML